MIVYFHRAFEDEKKARLGVVECVKHDLVEPYNVLYEKEGIFLSFCVHLIFIFIWFKGRSHLLRFS